MKIVIEGAGEVGSHLAKMLCNEANDVTVIDDDAKRLQNISASADVITMCGPAASIKTLKQAGVGKADIFIAVNPLARQGVNIVSALLAKRLGCPKVCARIDDEEYLHFDNKYIFTELGIDLMFYPEKIAAGEIVELLRRTTSTESMNFSHGKLQMVVFRLEEDSPLLEMKLAEFTAAVSREEVQFRVVAVSRGNKTLMPRFDMRFKYHDLVYIITTQDAVEPIMSFLGKQSSEVNKVMILGGGEIGEMVARDMSGKVKGIKIIDADKERCLELSSRVRSNVLVVNGNGRDADFLAEENIRDYDAFVAVTGNDELNVLSCVVAKKLGIARTIAEVENIEYINLAEEMGVDAVINKKLITASRIFKMTLSNKVRFIKFMSGTTAQVLEYIVPPGSPITRKQLKDTVFPTNAVIGGIIRGNQGIVAIGSTQIEAYDRVAIFALPEAVKEVDKFFK